MKRNYILTLLLFCCVITAFALESKTTLLKGNVTNSVSGEPMNIELEFKAEGSPKVKVQAMQGKYEQALTTNTKYMVTFVSKDVLREEIEIKVQDHKDAYNEQIMNFKVKKIAKGLEIKKFVLFENGTATMSSQGKKNIDDIKTLIRFNRTIEVELLLGEEMFAERMKALKDYIATMGAYSAKIKINPESKASLSGSECAITVGNVVAN